MRWHAPAPSLMKDLGFYVVEFKDGSVGMDTWEDGDWQDIEDQTHVRRCFLVPNPDEDGKEPKMSEWLPIETAPKDGGWILWCGDNGEYTRQRWSQVVIRWPEYKECFEQGWWQPLPTPPDRGEGKAVGALRELMEARAQWDDALGSGTQKARARAERRVLLAWERAKSALGCLSGRDAPSDEHRRAVLEEAAKIADEYAAKTPDNSLRVGAGWIASDIRALAAIPSPSTGGEGE